MIYFYVFLIGRCFTFGLLLPERCLAEGPKGKFSPQERYSITKTSQKKKNNYADEYAARLEFICEKLPPPPTPHPSQGGGDGV